MITKMKIHAVILGSRRNVTDATLIIFCIRYLLTSFLLFPGYQIFVCVMTKIIKLGFSNFINALTRCINADLRLPKMHAMNTHKEF